MKPNKFKLATWNINSIRSRITILTDFIALHQPDVIFLQELKCEEDKFPFEALESYNYNYVLSCQKAYNGVAILSKYPIEASENNFAHNPDSSQARYVEAVIVVNDFPLRLVNLYAPNGGEVDSDKYNYKLDFYNKLILHLKALVNLEEGLIVAGDFNIAAEEIDVYNPGLLQNMTCFTMKERRLLRSMINNGLVDAYRILNGARCEYTWWDYRAGALQHNKGLRIDHIYTSALTANMLKTCYIDHNTRTLAKTSDHAPVIAELQIAKPFDGILNSL